jgi:hypothetical protein
MSPKYTTQKSDDDTVDSSSSSIEQPLPPPSAAKSSSAFNRKKNARLTKISAQYDLDGDGILDEAEQAMRDRDINNNGFLSNEEIYDIVQDQLKAQKSAGYMKKLIGGLICFVVILALSNLGTSMAAAFLAKDLTADNGDAVSEGEEPPVPAMRIAKTGEIAGAQSISDVYVLGDGEEDEEEYTDEELDARRRLVLEELEEDPHSHPHRRLCSNSRKSVGCSGRINFDNDLMSEEKFYEIEKKCKMQQNVYLKKRRGDTERNDCLCKRGTSVVVKEKTKKIGRNNNGGNKKNKKDKNKKDKNNKIKVAKIGRKPRTQKGKNRVVIIEDEDGNSAHWDCEDGYCHGGGSLLQGELGDPCRLKADECRSNLICERTSKTLRSGSSTKYGVCAKPTKKSVVVIQQEFQRQERRGYRGDYCDIDLRDQCESGLWCEPDDFDNVVDLMRGRSGNGGGGSNGAYGGCGQGVVIAGPSGVIDTRQQGCGDVGGNGGIPRSARSGSVSGVGTCQRNAGSGQTCYDDWQCASGQCDGLGARNGGGNANAGGVISGPSGTIVYGQYNGGAARSNTGICY